MTLLGSPIAMMGAHVVGACCDGNVLIDEVCAPRVPIKGWAHRAGFVPTSWARRAAQVRFTGSGLLRPERLSLTFCHDHAGQHAWSQG